VQNGEPPRSRGSGLLWGSYERVEKGEQLHFQLQHFNVLYLPVKRKFSLQQLCSKPAGVTARSLAFELSGNLYYEYCPLWHQQDSMFRATEHKSKKHTGEVTPPRYCLTPPKAGHLQPGNNSFPRFASVCEKQ